jgi:hypothetical protein
MTERSSTHNMKSILIITMAALSAVSYGNQTAPETSGRMFAVAANQQTYTFDASCVWRRSNGEVKDKRCSVSVSAATLWEAEKKARYDFEIQARQEFGGGRPDTQIHLLLKKTSF